jgi:hypothetical protein
VQKGKKCQHLRIQGVVKLNITRTRRERQGFITLSESGLLVTMVLIGLIVAFASMRNSAVAEFGDLAESIAAVDQSYTVSGQEGGSLSIEGYSFGDNVDAGANDGVSILSAAPSQEDSATPVTPVPGFYAGDLTGNGSVNDVLIQNNTEAEYRYWAFEGSAGDNITAAVYRGVGNMDPYMYLFSGLLPTASTSHPGLLATADDNLGPAIPGPWADPLISYVLPADNFYTLIVRGLGIYDLYQPYTLTLSGSTPP